jgi:hypothetical protein
LVGGEHGLAEQLGVLHLIPVNINAQIISLRCFVFCSLLIDDGVLLLDGAFGWSHLIQIALQELEMSFTLGAVRVPEGFHAAPGAELNKVPMGVDPIAAVAALGKSLVGFRHECHSPFPW